ncbi:MAG: hypothetical protein OEM15_12020 [Myxococcales bacterium]|nr:hypothetical protein [Myxococcales bacterium]MDH3484471.1 hypothetical protein [Myxococcales bacterium]
MAKGWVAQLLDVGLVTEAQVRASDARNAQLPSPQLVRNLIAQGLDERILAGFFVSLGFGPMLQAQELARADVHLVRRLPGANAHELCAMPLRPSPAGAIVAMADPTDEEAVRVLSEALGGPILPTVAKLSDLIASLERTYPGDRPTLVSDPLALARQRHPSGVVPLAHGKPTAQKASTSDTGQTLQSFDPALLAATASPVWDRAWDRSTGGREHAPLPPSFAAPEVVEPDLAELGRVTTRDDVVRAGCQACLAAARGAAFLALRKGVFRGWDGAGGDITSAGIRSLWVPATNPSVLNDVAHSGEVFRGPFGQTAADHLLRAALGSRGREIVIAPVLIGTRMCGLLCAIDPGSDSKPVETVAEAMGRAFQRLIATQKSGV